MQLILCNHLRARGGGIFTSSSSVSFMFVAKRFMGANLFRPSAEVVEVTEVKEEEASLSKEPKTPQPPAIKPKRTYAWLTKETNHLPCFTLHPDQIEVIHEPVAFHERLIELASKSKKRITISSLYFGTQTSRERELIRTIYKTFINQEKLKLTFLVDCTRGTRREDEKSESSLDILKRFMYQADEVKKTDPPPSERCSFNFFLTTRYASLWRRLFILPRPRINETVAVQHIKCYIFDDTLIISGANLSEQYYTNRQDRYIVFKNATQLADYYDELVQLMSRFSLHIDRDQVLKERSGKKESPRIEEIEPQISTLKSSPDWPYHPLSFFSRIPFRREARKQINDFNRRWKERYGTLDSMLSPDDNSETSTTTSISSISKEYQPSEDDISMTQETKTHDPQESDHVRGSNDRKPVYIVPLLQMKEFGIRDDERFTMNLMMGPPAMEFKLVSGYFNLIKEYQLLLIKKAMALQKGVTVETLFAHEEANGFYGAKGLRRLIPRAYSYYAWDFLRRIKHMKVDANINLWAWKKDGWTFHAKGLWISSMHDDDCAPTDYMFATIGSPNFGYRSVYCDIESQLAMITADKELKLSFEKEYRRLWHNAVYVEPILENNPQLPLLSTPLINVADILKRYF